MTSVPDHLTFRKRLVGKAFDEFKTVPVVQTRSVAETKKRKAVGHDPAHSRTREVRSGFRAPRCSPSTVNGDVVVRVVTIRLRFIAPAHL